MKSFYFIFILFITNNIYADNNPYYPWIIFDGKETSPRQFESYKLIIFDSQSYPPLKPLLDRNKIILGYLSLNEVQKNRNYFRNTIQSTPKTSQQNPLSQKQKKLDQHKNWTKLIIEEYLPQMIHRGFHGVLIETLNRSGDSSQHSKQRQTELTSTSINLIKTIHYHYPHLKIMLKTGYDVLPAVINDINMVLTDSLFSQYDFAEKKYSFVNKDKYQQHLQQLNNLYKKNRKLVIFTLDYWKHSDKSSLRKIYQTHKTNGFLPYVSEVQLNKVYEEPKRQKQ